MWNGIYRSLRIRGLVDRNLRLTDGRAALAQCKFFSPLFTASLTNQARGMKTLPRVIIGFRPDVERQLTDGRRPMQFILIVVTIAAAILFDVRPSGAYQGPWCAVENIGDDVRYDCSMRTLEQCVPLIIAGNRGFCLPNPYYRGPEAAPPRVKRKR